MKSSIDIGKRLVTTVAEGVLDLTTIIEHTDSLKADSRFNPTFDQIADFSAVTDIRLSPADIRHLAARSIFSSHSRRAAVAPNDLVFALGRVFESYRWLFSGTDEGRIFRNKADAAQWLLGKQQLENQSNLRRA
jgi:hypothetical protein